jgi:hypothetical protein
MLVMQELLLVRLVPVGIQATLVVVVSVVISGIP